MRYRYNGSSWTRIRLPRRDPLYAVWGTGASAVYAGGAGGSLYRFNGAAWVPEKALGGASQIYGFWGTGADVFAAGGGGLIAKR